jgi:L-threonylcarbamoyladenylate synthase
MVAAATAASSRPCSISPTSCRGSSDPGQFPALRLKPLLAAPLEDRAAGRLPPRAQLEVVAASTERVGERLRQGVEVGWLTCGSLDGGPLADGSRSGRLHRIDLPAEADSYARSLYAALHQLDAAGVDCIIVERPPQEEAWQAIHDRLTRASRRE